MPIDWLYAGRLGLVGFGTVLIVLAVMAVIMWLAAQIIRKVAPEKPVTTEKKKGA